MKEKEIKQFKLNPWESSENWMSEIDKADFWTNCIKTDYCWEWQRWLNKGGYGQFSFNSSTIPAHRISYALTRNVRGVKINLICHKCDNPRCINPAHLFETDEQGNMMDRQMKYRGRKSLKSSTYMGVNYARDRNKWRARVTADGKHKCVGEFKTEIEAAKAYDNAMIERYGYEKVKDYLNIKK